MVGPKLVPVATFTKSWEAQLARVKLEAAGIPAFVQDEHFGHGGPAPAIQISLVVPEPLLEQARAELQPALGT